LPARAAAEVLPRLDGDFPERIGQLSYADVAVVVLGFQRRHVAHPLDGFGLLAPEVERRHVLGCLFSSSLFPRRAPPEHVALAAFVGGARHPERVAQPADTIARRVLDDLRPLLGLDGEPEVQRVECWRPAIPQYRVGHGDLVQAAQAFERAAAGIFVSGNLLGGVSVGDCIRNATALAARVQTFLGRML
ncbi:MAG TPA: protoporphyrinogen oxidase, partial [Candidatus Polarisedimenticolaceae bacterium]|nr:protoporphyrinogen oxidase [Candidatus Polarisedimenticolaceae bacterium]